LVEEVAQTKILQVVMVVPAAVAAAEVWVRVSVPQDKETLERQ
jgi:hypothetical protein